MLRTLLHVQRSVTWPAAAACQALGGAAWSSSSGSYIARPPPGLAATAAAAAAAPASLSEVRWSHAERTVSAESLPLRTGRPRLVVLGTGWAAARLLRDIDPQLYDITVVSPRNHMVFTPLLASATVGTLEARSVAVHVKSIQPAIHDPQNQYIQGDAVGVFPERRLVECCSEDGVRFYVKYDKLAVCTGSQGSTFGIPGVEEHAHFLRDVRHAEVIRNKLIDNIARAGVPGRDLEEFQRLLHVVIVGGGPTGVEAAGELSNLINRDLRRLYPQRAKSMMVTVIEAKELLGTFDGSLREYAARKLVQQGVQLRKGVVQKVEPTSLTLTDGTRIPFGLCIWSTGVGPTPFTMSLPFARTSVGRIAVDGQMRVLAPPKQEADGHVRDEGAPVASSGGRATPLTDEAQVKEYRTQVVPDVYALGDCCANTSNPLPALAQVAEQQGKYLAKLLNDEEKNLTNEPPKPFVYKNLGSMATVGGTSAILELSTGSSKHLSVAGFLSWIAWRSAYLTRLGSFRNRCVVAFDWLMTLVFGRDLSRW